MENPGDGIVYTETLVYSPTPQFVNDVPYQLAIVQLASGKRLTARIVGERAAIGDGVAFLEYRDQVPYFQKQ
ncbi:MAG: OB-fold domain-containing protein [Acidobacteriaceae bacterium]|nr:OB-fold domain-containing protein [Acidobacteriaceae bacterium]